MNSLKAWSGRVSAWQVWNKDRNRDIGPHKPWTLVEVLFCVHDQCSMNVASVKLFGCIAVLSSDRCGGLQLWHAWGTIRVGSLALCWGAYLQIGWNLKLLPATACHHAIWGLTIHTQIKAWATNSRTTGKPLVVLAAIMTPDVSSDQSWNQWAGRK